MLGVSKDLSRWLKDLRIGDQDAEKYALRLQELGFDDVRSVCEDVEERDLAEFMRTGHVRRVLRAVAGCPSPRRFCSVHDGFDAGGPGPSVKRSGGPPIGKPGSTFNPTDTERSRRGFSGAPGDVLSGLPGSGSALQKVSKGEPLRMKVHSKGSLRVHQLVLQQRKLLRHHPEELPAIADDVPAIKAVKPSRVRSWRPGSAPALVSPLGSSTGREQLGGEDGENSEDGKAHRIHECASFTAAPPKQGRARSAAAKLEEDKRGGPARGLRIDIEDSGAGADGVLAADLSYEFSTNGTLHVEDFQIDAFGLRQAPVLACHTTSALSARTVLDEELRSTASGAITRRADERSPEGRPPSSSVASPGLGAKKEQLIFLEELGRGACGTVHKAIDVPTLRLVAVKTVYIHQSEKRRQMVRELRALHSLASPSRNNEGEACSSAAHGASESKPIIGFHNAYSDPRAGAVCIVLEYMNAGTLQDLVNASVPASEHMLAAVAFSVLRGLRELHGRKQIHRDIKPSNILLDRAGNIKISDFGVSRELLQTLEKAQTFTGTVLYMSPERITAQQYSYSSDIWSLGLCLVTLALGHFPLSTGLGYWGVVQAIQDSPPPSLPPGSFSADLRDLVGRCLRKDPGKRATASELLCHPFLRRCALPLRPGLAPEVTEANLRALKELVTRIVEHRVDSVRRGASESSSEAARQLGPWDSSALRALSEQLGMPNWAVSRIFMRARERANRDLTRLFTSKRWPQEEDAVQSERTGRHPRKVTDRAHVAPQHVGRRARSIAVGNRKGGGELLRCGSHWR